MLQGVHMTLGNRYTYKIVLIVVSVGHEIFSLSIGDIAKIIEKH